MAIINITDPLMTFQLWTPAKTKTNGIGIFKLSMVARKMTS
jgi:hypothetical protein